MCRQHPRFLVRALVTMSVRAGMKQCEVGLRENQASSLSPKGGAMDSSSRKRKAPSIASPASVAAVAAAAVAAAAAGTTQQPLVPATDEGLKEMRRRVATVVQETMRDRLAGSEEKGKGKGVAGGGMVKEKQDATTAAYLRAFQVAVASKVASMCDVQDARETLEAEDLMNEIVRFGEDMQTARERLHATRARVARLSASVCNDSLRVAEAEDDRACEILEASAEHARREREAGGPLPTAGGEGGAGGDGRGEANGGFSGIDADVLEPKVSLLIGKLSELPGPLKAVLQEIPELTASLAKTVQSVEAAMGAGQSRTEALLGKAPPTPITAARAGGEGKLSAGGEERPPEEARASAREARVEQARKEWEAAGVGTFGGIFS